MFVIAIVSITIDISITPPTHTHTLILSPIRCHSMSFLRDDWPSGGFS